MDRFAAMQGFAAVARRRSFAGGARELGISVAAVSRRVAELERALGVRLLQRTTRRVSPTEVGQAYYERCVRVLAELEEIERAARDQHGAPSGTLRVSAPVALGQAQLAALLPAFLDRHRQVSIELDLADRFVDVVAEGFDVAVRVAALADSSPVARRLAVATIATTASPAYLAARGTPRTPRDLRAHACIADRNMRAPFAWSFRRARREQSVPISGPLMVNSASAAREAALAGAGIARSPSFLVADDLAAGRLAPVLPAWSGPELAISVVWPSNRHLSAKVRAFVDFLAERFADARWAAV